MNKWIIVEDCDGKQHIIRNISELYVTYGLPEPTTQKPVFSMEFREKVSTCGFVFEAINDDETNMIEYIPPAQIKRVKFMISTNENAINKKQLLKG